VTDKVKTVAVDIDGVLAAEPYKGAVYSTEAGWCYENCVPLPNGFELVRRLKAKGFRVVLYTARWEANRGVTEKWLRDYGLEGLYDELRMDKQSAVMYIDDRGFRWDDARDEDIDSVAALLEKL